MKAKEKSKLSLPTLTLIRTFNYNHCIVGELLKVGLYMDIEGDLSAGVTVTFTSELFPDVLYQESVRGEFVKRSHQLDHTFKSIESVLCSRPSPNVMSVELEDSSFAATLKHKLRLVIFTPFRPAKECSGSVRISISPIANPANVVEHEISFVAHPSEERAHVQNINELKSFGRMAHEGYAVLEQMKAGSDSGILSAAAARYGFTIEDIEAEIKRLETEKQDVFFDQPRAKLKADTEVLKFRSFVGETETLSIEFHRDQTVKRFGSRDIDSGETSVMEMRSRDAFEIVIDTLPELLPVAGERIITYNEIKGDECKFLIQCCKKFSSTIVASLTFEYGSESVLPTALDASLENALRLTDKEYNHFLQSMLD